MRCSCASPPVPRPRRLSSIELRREPVEACFPQIPVPTRPILEFLESVRAQGVNPSPAVGADPYETRVLQDRELARYTSLADVNGIDQLGHGALARSECLDEAAPGGIAQDLEDIGHGDILLAQHMSLQQCVITRRTVAVQNDAAPRVENGSGGLRTT